jgi:sulfite exporter TauE/SafE
LTSILEYATLYFMLTPEITILLVTAASIGFFHTLLGPDHYLPFIVMSQSGRWSVRKTALVTLLCGIGHVLGSVLLGVAGIALGIAVSRLEFVESFRGGIAAWALIAFGLAYFAWGVRRVIKNRPHEHHHRHADGSVHVHTHVHADGHYHVHAKGGSQNITPWILFTIFVLGPCEPLIPLLMYPAARENTMGVLLVTIAFAVVTVITMLGVVLISVFGLNLMPPSRLQRYSHALAGATICLSGIAIHFLGL